MIEVVVPEHCAYLTSKHGTVVLMPEVREWLDETIPDARVFMSRETVCDEKWMRAYATANKEYVCLGWLVLELSSERDAVLWQLRWGRES